ncbi:1-aminocyclopropane-1-carboxylate deaminase/D-cysteine desulfhydrase [Lunatimonas salinarum]|uniref:1-aminocyclopropane-1-carboxylate deaminase/D-cysteine desulfhydrase n=1 Tax=Lunatimonas salinarum TaxID=1774590 RepID=UPI001AE05AEA|nr:pyridoxal-phosphate dependent enzyme [Lunatimonas salinarum]
MFPHPLTAPLQRVVLPILETKKVDWFVKRLDLVHPLLSGNKYYKLKYNMLHAQREGTKRLLTFGGAFSNHIYSAAAAAHLAKMEIIGCIRGEISTPLNPTLQAASDMGMILFPMERNTYRNKSSPQVIEMLREQFGNCYLIPEGGTNSLAIRGCQEILDESDRAFDTICTSLGTGGTMAGILASANAHQHILGFSALKGDFVQTDFEELLRNHSLNPAADWEIFTHYHCGGYAKHSAALLELMRSFFRTTGIPLDPIYTGKMVMGILDLLEKDYFRPGSRLLMIHSGGLQGNKGFEWRWKQALYPE